MVWILRARKERRLAERDAFRRALSDLHVETLTTELDEDMRWDYQRSLDLYEESKAALATAQTASVVATISTVLDDGRFYLACVLA